MRAPLKPIWDKALEHWDEVLPTASDFASAITEVNVQFEMYLNFCRFGDEWTDADVLLAAFVHCGYKEMIPGMPIEPKHFEINDILWKRYRERYD